ncbi:MAG: 16S rRNA (cytosine(1402)-N(4))-methyltransferase RsmH [Planctomycetes bacterium]|nr:16S rRNA (cytosine(1402)-N(4))-methyltransferase RsmH [Planctomycetota bacterium]
MDRVHEPVLVEEVLGNLSPEPGQTLLDLTVGAGGHAARLLARLGPQGVLVGVDRDPAILQVARKVLAPFGACAILRTARSDGFRALLQELQITAVHGVLLDLGVSSLQLDDPARGFSFRAEGPLDMRMDATQGRSARDLLLSLTEPELTHILFRYGEEPFARRIAKELKAIPRGSMPRTTTELAELVERVVPRRIVGRSAVHPATRVFQALRIAVNDELGVLERTLPAVAQALVPGGRVVVISFHSLEDRIVKNYFRSAKQSGVFAEVSRKPILADEAEVQRNPRARSAKLRFAVKAVGALAA